MLSAALASCLFILPFANVSEAAEDKPLTEQEKAAVVNLIVTLLLDDTSNNTPDTPTWV